MNTKTRALLIFAAFFLVLLSLPTFFTQGARGFAVASFSPLWKELVDVKVILQSVERYQAEDDVLSTKDQEIQRLLLENQLLGNEIERLKEIVEEEHQLYQQFNDEPVLKDVSKKIVSKHQKEILDLFELELSHIPAKVIYRPLNTWNSSLWIDKGEADNRKLGRIVISKNSPVVIGTSVVGVVEEVNENQSRITLITDARLNPSVRVKRGKWLLAKGELSGESQPKFRSHQSRLKGVGFNCDFDDPDSPARDLRTGKPLDSHSKYPTMPLVQLEDLLVTTGMDGVFPPGLKIGRVKHIDPLKEGDFTYNLEAESSAGDLNELTIVFVLPALRD